MIVATSTTGFDILSWENKFVVPVGSTILSHHTLFSTAPAGACTTNGIHCGVGGLLSKGVREDILYPHNGEAEVTKVTRNNV
ncbi:hypothetical protein OUZ56_000044 [Daphnia magna]|uniref:Uncharacterized protein n=1 Tax=Daphnia magna TaxID=35525 RepID=A0ABQ9ZYJ3_9CRUS|nr:hypothetical protein OUZ56_000044 [Daphnia magna]